MTDQRRTAGRAARVSSPSRRPAGAAAVSPSISRRRMQGLTLGILVVFSLFAGQLLRIQGLDAAALAKQAQEMRMGDEIIAAPRGQITTSNGTVLASTLERVTVVVDQTAVCTYQQKSRSTCDPRTSGAAISAAAAQLAPLLDIPVATLEPMLTGTLRWRVLKKEVSPLTWRKVRALGIPGVDEDKYRVMKRVYPTSTTAASLVGFVLSSGEAGGGVEAMLDKTLAGKPGRVVFDRDLDGQPIPTGRQTLTPAVPGKGATLTIDSDLQWYAQNVLAQKVNDVEAESGTAIVMTRTGRVLALASYPTFDPNHLEKASKKGLRNNAFQDVFEPGSTAKVMTIAAAMETGKVTPSTPFVIPPQLKLPDFTLKDSHEHGTEYLTTAGVLAVSSNIGTVLAGERMTSAQLDAYFRKFGLGSATGSGFPGEASGIFPPWQKLNRAQRTTMMYGQGVSATAMQAAGVFQTIANDGVRVPPQLIDSTTAPGAKAVKVATPKGQRVVSATTAKDLRTMLEGVVSKDGTAPEAQVEGYRVAGKTGTANRYDDATGKYAGYTASFIGMAPADDPELVVAVIVQRPVKGHYGGSVAGPVFRQIMSYALQKEKIPPTTSTATPLRTTLSSPPAASDPSVVRVDAARR